MTPKEFKIFRKKMGMTQVELANYLRKSAMQIKKYEKGTADISKELDDSIRHKALALDIKLEDK